MTWFTMPLERKSGGWGLIAESDEDGGFVEGCQHAHATADEAMKCVDARRVVAQTTGFPDLFLETEPRTRGAKVAPAEHAKPPQSIVAAYRGLSVLRTMLEKEKLNVGVQKTIEVMGWLAEDFPALPGLLSLRGNAE